MENIIIIILLMTLIVPNLLLIITLVRDINKLIKCRGDEWCITI